VSQAVGPSPVHRPRSKWIVAGGYWLCQAGAIILVPPVFMGAETPSIDHALDAVQDDEYLSFAVFMVTAITLLQAGMIAPIRRPDAAPHSRPGLLRSAAAGLSIGCVVSAVFMYLLHWVRVFDLLQFPEFWFDHRLMLLFLGMTAFVGIPAAAYFHRKYRDGMPVRISLAIAGLISGLLIGGVVTATLELIDVVRGTDLDPDLWGVVAFASPFVGWIVATPLLIAFARRRTQETAISRIASLLFIGSIVEAVAVLPLDIMVRRRSSCYCEEGTFWTLIASSTAGVLALGPMLYLLPIRRRATRLVQGRCAVCGYDLSATPKVDRCPECGAGWREPPREAALNPPRS
jgi:hypothetical protein